jgi:guanosine-diphosphatase
MGYATTPVPPKPATTDAVRPKPVDINIPSGQGSERPLPGSFKDDPDPSKTVRCTHPADPSKPLVQFALMVDAGSTGSRIHIYKFNNCGASPEYEYEVFEMTKPGLSSYATEPARAAESLDVLLDTAMRTVPAPLRSCTPIAVKATAGLRLLGVRESGAILDAVRARLHDKYPFPLHDADGQGVVIMDGKDEGVYAWITANYLLRTIRADTPAGTPSYAVLDLGGASTQIVFEPTFDKAKPDSRLEEGEHKYDLDFGGKKRVLYQHSYLGYGLMRARKSVHRLVEFMASLRTPGDTIANPCLARGTERVVEVEDERAKSARNVTMSGEDIGSFEACNRVVELVMAKDS